MLQHVTFEMLKYSLIYLNVEQPSNDLNDMRKFELTTYLVIN